MASIARTVQGYDTAVAVDEKGRLLLSPISDPSFPSVLQKITHIAAAGDFLIHSSLSVIWGFTSNISANKATMTIYDGIDNTGAVIGNFDVNGVYNMAFPGNGIYLRVGLFIHVTVATDVTVVSGDMTTLREVT